MQALTDPSPSDPLGASHSPLPAPALVRGPAPGKIRVLCVDDSEDVPMMLSRCIARETDMECAGSLTAADDLEAEADSRRADVVLLDMSMPGKEPLDALRELLAACKARGGRSASGGRCARVIAYSGRGDEEAIDDARRAGACGFVNKDQDIPRVLAAIRVVAAGGEAFGSTRHN